MRRLGPDTRLTGSASEHLPVSAALRRRIPGWGKLWAAPSLLSLVPKKQANQRAGSTHRDAEGLERWENPETQEGSERPEEHYGNRVQGPLMGLLSALSLSCTHRHSHN